MLSLFFSEDDPYTIIVCVFDEQQIHAVYAPPRYASKYVQIVFLYVEKCCFFGVPIEGESSRTRFII